MGYKIAEIEELKKKLNELPEVNNLEREVSKKEAVKLMVNEVAILKKKGYTTEKIAELITNNGIQISSQTLKSYLTRAKNNSRMKIPRKITTTSTLSSKEGEAELTTSSSNHVNNLVDESLNH